MRAQGSRSRGRTLRFGTTACRPTNAISPHELAAEKVQKNAKDVFLDEAVHILSDEVGILKTGVRLAARAKPGSALTPD